MKHTIKRNSVFVLLFLATVLWNCNGKSGTETEDDRSQGFKVIGYLPGRSVDTTAIPYGLLTHINFAFAIPAKTGGGLDALRNADKLTALVKKAHENNVKVFISIGGWSVGDGGGDDSRFHRMAENGEQRNYFVTKTMQMVHDYDLDGVDLDWEYPDIENRSAEDYVLLMKQLADSLHAENLQLTAAVVHYGNQGRGIKNEIFDIVDWLNLMAYDDDHGQPVPHSPFSLAEKSINYWIRDRGLPPSKAVLGLPFYGKPRRPNLSHYKDLIAAGADPYADEYDSVYYNGVTTIQRKTRLAQNEKLAGVMIWEIGQDTHDEHSLLKAINDTIIKE